MAIFVVHSVCGLSLLSGNMVDLVYILLADQCHGADAEDGQYGTASFVRSSSVNVRGQYKATFFQGYQGDLDVVGKVGDLHNAVREMLSK